MGQNVGIPTSLQLSALLINRLSHLHIIDPQFANILTIICWCVPLIHSLSLNINMYKEASTRGHVV